MHPRSRYCHNKPDFGALAEAHPPLKPFLIQKRGSCIRSQTLPGPFAFTIDFSNPAALRELTCALLARDFGLKLEIPLDKLIPTVPLRLNYIHWVEDLLSSSPGSIPRGDTVVGIDIGTGASCIYPLLGARLNGWRFLATEVEEDSVKYARENVARNALEDKISVKQVTENTVLEGALDPSVRYHFCMCNPPFFKDQAERYGNQSRSGHRPLPGTVSTGVGKETVTEGGEVQFVRRMVADSLRLGDTVRWYTSMLGKKASLKAIQTELKKHQIPVMTTTEFVQGKTWRWAVAWSFDESLKEKVSQPARKDRCHRPFKLLVSCYQPTAEGFQKVLQWLQGQLSELKISYDIGDRTSENICLNCQAHRNTWSHQRKRRRLLEKLKQQHARSGQKETSEDTVTASGVSGGSESNFTTSIGPQTQVEAYTNTAAAQSFGNVTKELLVGTLQEPPSVAADLRRKDITSQGSDQNEKNVVVELDSGCTTRSDTDTPTISSIAASEFSQSATDMCYATTGKPKQKPLLLPTSFKETVQDQSQQPLDELDTMYTPCHLEFQCSVVLGSTDELPCTTKKRRKSDGSTEATLTSGSGNRKSDKGIILSFELIRGDDKDSLHQIVQYMKNKLQLLQ